MSGLGRLSVNPLDGAIQSVPWLKGGLHHALIAAALLALAGWLSVPALLAGGLIAGYYVGESVGSYVVRFQAGLAGGWRDPLTDALWPATYVALYLTAGPWVALPALIGAGCLRWVAWSRWGV